jgi:carboxylate-amine ligase
VIATTPAPSPPYPAPAAVYDEAVGRRSGTRPQYRALVDALARTDLAGLVGRTADALAADGVRFGDGGPFVVDPVPRIVTAREWSELSAGLVQRVRALEAFVADVYDRRECVREGVVPEAAIASADHLDPRMSEVRPARWIPVAGLDVVRDARGRWLVLEDNVRTPSGIAYAAAARGALAGAHDPPPELMPADGAYALLGRALRAAAVNERSDPQIVVLTDGPGNSAFYEHLTIARRLGAPLVTLAQLEHSNGRLKRRVGRSLMPIDIVYRRTDEDRLTDAAGRPTAVGEALLGPARQGRVAVVNAFGTGVADDKLVHSYVEGMVRFYLREEPLLRSVPTYDLRRPHIRARALARIDDLVVKPRTGHGGHGVVIGPHALAADRRRAAAAIEARPDAFVAQETISLSTHPTVIGDRLEPRHIDLRPFVYWTASGPEVAPAALSRVAFGRGALVVNSSQAGGAKDTWALA